MKRLIRITLIIIFAMAFCFGSWINSQAQSRLEQIVKRGYLIVGTGSETPPFGFVDEKGELVGFDIDIGRLLAKAMFGDDTKVQFVKQSFASRWENVDNGAVDVGIHVTTIHSQRPMKVAFTTSYIDNETVALARKDPKITKFEDLNSEKYTITLLNVPIFEQIAKLYLPKAKTNILNSVADQFTAVKVGRAHAALGDLPTMAWYGSKNPDLRVFRGWKKEGASSDAVYMKQGDFTLWLTVETYMREMVQGHLYEDYATIYKKWFGERPHHGKYYFAN